MTLQIDFLPWDCGMKLGRLAIPCGYWTYRRTDRPTVLSISRTLVLEGLIVLCERWLRSSPSDQTCRFRVSTLALYSAPRWCKMYFLECVYIYIMYICMYIYIMHIYTEFELSESIRWFPGEFKALMVNHQHTVLLGPPRWRWSVKPPAAEASE